MRDEVRESVREQERCRHCILHLFSDALSFIEA